MNLSSSDQQIFQAIKQVCQGFDLKYSHHTYLDYLLTIIFSADKAIMGPNCDFSIVLDTAYHSISFRCTLPQPVPRKKRRDLYDALNQVNFSLTKIKMVIQHPDPKFEIREEMELFDYPFKTEHFEKILGRFLVVSTLYVQLIDRFLKGEGTKDDVIDGVDHLTNLQGVNSGAGNKGPGDFPYPS